MNMRQFFIVAIIVTVGTPVFAQQPSAPIIALAPRTADSLPLSTVVLKDALSLRDAPITNAVDLEAFGYVEEEYFLTTPAYTTRILLRRPADAEIFSGTVLVEPLPEGTEWPIIWTAAWPYITKHQDVWVGVTISQNNIETLFKKVNPGRYSTLNIPDKISRFNILAQTGLILRDPNGPLGKTGLLDRASTLKGLLQVFGVGWGASSGCTQTEFINEGHHLRAKRENGRPIFTGYVIGGCSQTGRISIPGDAPVIALATESDYRPELIQATLDARFDDGNTPGKNRSRWYDIVGAASASWRDHPKFAISLFQANNATAPDCAKPITTLPGRDNFLRGAFFALDLWTRMGIAPQAGRVMDLDDDKMIKHDRDGNTSGGLRPHWVAVPVSTFSAQSGGDGFCAESGTETALPPEHINELYESREDYLAKVAAHLDMLVMGRLLVYDDAKTELDDLSARAFP